MSTRLNFRTCNKTIFWSTSINNEEFNQQGQFSVIQFISSKKSFRQLPKRLFTRGHETSSREPRYWLKGKGLRLSFIHATRCRQNLKKRPTLTIHHSYTHTHIPPYVSKDNHFYPTYFGPPWNHLFDRLY